MPIGMQLVAKPWAEGLLLRVASVLEATHAGV
jgi:Asp-tRNA(Asn)/Glu-tRNA(Gln) amidotransferase A subunit family amidase